MDKKFIEGMQGFMGLVANEVQTEIEVPNESKDFVDYVKSETVKQVYRLYVKNTGIFKSLIGEHLKENLQFHLEIGPKPAIDIWRFIMEQDFWESLLRKSIIVAYKQGKAGIGVYDLTAEKFKPCEEGEHFRKIIELILEEYPIYKDLLLKGANNLSDMEDIDMNEFILTNFILCGPEVSKSLNIWTNPTNKRTAEVMTRTKGLEELKNS